MRTAVSAALLLFVGVSLVYLVIGGQESPEGRPASPVDALASRREAGDVTPAEGGGPKLVAYYFHGDFRCTTCRAMERYAKEAVEETFADQIKRGAIAWRAINFNKSENEHYIKTYDLSASAVVLADVTAGKLVRWRNLGLIWELVDDETAYKAYIIKEVEEMMEQGS